ncbi:MAG: ABC transporter ATP-binding protein [Microcystis sp.]|jgi:ATP-binding cassette subfamily B multidrug efflux pump|uniref:ABC transporter ATP-binding protein n=1 Tax=Microcystis flos-aquae Mf_QC_C_20070823_S10D TaxID=2486236 RepID=A0A552L5E4_9CHRO|nr:MULTISPECIES: ABC transporter ATP-binding protein [unclassified Microcystis]MCA2817884.1 ABC transporter ATP-binding protein [Microcystis sp. M085S1]MCA2856338.1 ABC transporter ATP-binding protein [Microcystis sp. M065S1]TRT77752.1 MAG: ABC transporter ATP-binding protein [Microcystis flos-aquae Ma_QC_C_20070823_S18]TRU01660.1 MAG: ABC transporter ATP-binding protein [Microcystis flos-aquae Ma_QC_C_20070823_S18D]TRV15451.1 MAG: ABC transporter ATP-binding protein [Microcystis flos-aquae Mf
MSLSSPPVSPPVKENDWSLLLRLLPYAKKQKALLFCSLILLFPLSLTGAIQPLIIGQAVSLLQKEQTWDFLAQMPLTAAINTLIIILSASIILRLILGTTQGYLVQKVGQSITANVREDLFSHVTSLSSSFFDRSPVGRLVTRLTSDVEALGEVFASGAIGVVSDLVNILVIIITMFTLQWQLALLLVLMLFPVTVLIIFFQKQYRIANYQVREELSKLNAQLQENVVGVNIVQLFRRERFNAEMFRATNTHYRRSLDKTIFYDSAVSATLEWIGLIAVGGVLWLGGIFILQKTIDFGVLSAFILFSQRLFNPLRQFAEKFTMFQSGFTAIERIGELISIPIEITDSNNYKEISFPEKCQTGEIIFENVWFGYKPDEYIIKGLNFTIHPGEKVALVGPTGAGKSSIIRLLCRLYEPSKGRILVDGIDIRYLPQGELRRYIGVILQETFLFAGDVTRNITLGENYDFEQVKAAAKLTNIDHFIEELPDGYHTRLRERGANLSGGQKQLLAFARVAIRNPEILVLDEATASLDVGTEVLIQEALEQILVDRTAIIIAHRLSTIRNVDRILVLKRGELVESGTHEDLLTKDGLYASLSKIWV